MKKVRHVHPKTGEVEFVPIGVDPGWNYNPGVSREGIIGG